MFKKHYVLAIICFLLIPIITVSAALLSNAINPEVAAGHPNYASNFRLLNSVKILFLLAGLLMNTGLWFLTCLFLVKSKMQSSEWCLLAILGPFGLIILTMLNDKAPALGDYYQPFVGKLKIYLRAPLEVCRFVLVWVVANQTMVFERNLMIMYRAANTGSSRAQIINQQNASGGMWAFSEFIEVIYLVVLIYLLWPICFNAVGHLRNWWDSPKKA